MPEDIEIEDASGRIGSVTFNRSPQVLTATRTASGFEIQVPIEITLRVRLAEDPIAMISNICGKVLVKTHNGVPIRIGTLSSDFRSIAGISTTEAYYNRRDERLQWTGTFADLAYIEKARDGKPPEFQMHIESDLSFLVRPPVQARCGRKRAGGGSTSSNPGRTME